MEPELKTTKMTELETGSGAPKDMYPESETEKLPGSDADKDSKGPLDKDLEPEEYHMEQKVQREEKSRTGTDWDSHTPEGMDPESGADELSGSDTDWDSGAPGDRDPASETEKLSGSDTEWAFGEPEGKALDKKQGNVII